LGIFGGSFDPIHIGHLVAAANVRYSLQLDSIRFVVAGQPWQKVERGVSDAEVRFQAVSAALAGVEAMEASRMEVDRPGPSYMADTLGLIRQENPEAELFLIVGTDVAGNLDSWVRSDEVAELAELAVVNRPGCSRVALSSKWRLHEVEIPPLEVSSTDLRARLADGRPVDFLIPTESLVFLRPKP